MDRSPSLPSAHRWTGKFTAGALMPVVNFGFPALAGVERTAGVVHAESRRSARVAPATCGVVISSLLRVVGLIGPDGARAAPSRSRSRQAKVGGRSGGANVNPASGAMVTWKSILDGEDNGNCTSFRWLTGNETRQWQAGLEGSGALGCSRHTQEVLIGQLQSVPIAASRGA